jgi:23S rRNA pseudouridine1911/1915/1917 synthase
MNTQQSHQIIVAQDCASERLDKFLSSQINELTRARIQALIEQGAVLKNNIAVASSSYKVKMGDVFTVTIPELVPTEIIAENIPLNIVYEDDDLLVIDKAVGMVVHPAAGVYSGTLVNALLHHCKGSLSGIGGVMRPGIVHRLDKDTSGLMLVAKHDKAHNGLSAQLQDRSLKRTYHAFCYGVMQPRSGTIDAPIARSKYDRQKMAIVEGGKQAITHYQTLEIFKAGGYPFASLIECNLKTGRTHQIRVHLSAAACPLIGDQTYCNTTKKLASLKKYLPDDRLTYLHNFHRQALHAVRLQFIHPVNEKMLDFSSNYPEDIQLLLDFISKNVN